MPVTYPNATHISENFTWVEFGIRDSGKGLPPAHRANLVRLCTVVLERVRKHFGGNAVVITDGYRYAGVQLIIWNNAVKKYGSARAASAWVARPGGSQHEKGCAADLYVVGVPLDKVTAYLATIPEVGGLNQYPDGFVHADLRKRVGGKVVTW